MRKSFRRVTFLVFKSELLYKFSNGFEIHVKLCIFLQPILQSLKPYAQKTDQKIKKDVFYKSV